jgi:regulator of chromosome condensation
LSKIVQLAAGSNHILALDSSKKRVMAWGSGQQCQLARKLIERNNEASLIPQGIGSLGRGVHPVKVACGSYHSFAINEHGQVYAWGLNNYGELGLDLDSGEDGGTVLRPTLVESLSQYKIASIAGGEHHSIACTEDGKLLTWGRIDGYQVGMPPETFTKENTIYDEHDKPRILKEPTVVQGIPPIAFVAAGTDHSIAITRDGQAYSWGFSVSYQTGQGTDDDIKVPTLIDNTAVRGKTLTWAGAGGQYSMLACASQA